MRWEYDCLEYEAGAYIVGILNISGMQGWELVSVVVVQGKIRFYLKRMVRG